MSDRENYNASNENQEDIRNLICEFRAVIGIAPPSEEEIERTYAVWEHFGAVKGISALEFGKNLIAIDKLEKKIDAESKTLEEWQARREMELGLSSEPSETMGALDIAINEIEWLETKTGCKDEEIHRLSSEYDRLADIVYQNPGNEEAESALERFGDKFEEQFSKTKKHLQSVLALQQKQNFKPSMDVPVKHTTPCARAASRARRTTSPPTITQGGGGSGGDNGDSDSSDSDPPGPGARAHHLYPLTSSKRNKPRHLNRRISRCSWRVSEGGRFSC
ncbi:MAG: hypothetical protein LBL05_09795 [Synergistaceae bacterium]|jgi:hypothetical protein|nr:hypothetical protein [Synergistaceae bacterium]